MLDIRTIAQDPELWTRRLARRGAGEGLAEAIELDAQRRALIMQVDALRNERTTTSAAMRDVDKKSAEFAQVRDRMRQVSADIKRLEADKGEVEARLADHMLTIPNAPEDDAPDGADETGNVEVRRWGTPRTFDFAARNHWDVGEDLGIFDFERGAKIAGKKFTVLRRGAARLERALHNFMLDLHTTEHDYTEVLTPFLVNPESMRGTGQFPKFKDDAYILERDDLVLVPTAEVPLTNLHRDEILEYDALPKRYTAFTPCFRREAGGYGADTRGYIRQHQFQKVELVHIVRPEDSADALEALTGHAEVVLQRLGLPYRVMDLCAGDLGFGAARTYDLEVWLPGQGAYREISSCSNCRDFQARRAMIRYRAPDVKKAQLVHTLNGSGLAIGRTLVAILENYQRADGKVDVPEALVPYMGGVAVIE